MRFSIIAFVGAIHLAVAQLPANPTCNHDNCLRAVIASAFPTRLGSADCASYFRTTVVTNSAAQTVIPTRIPAYASACSGAARYSSACSCIGATHTTTSPTGYVIVSPTSCPPSAPTGSPIAESDSTFSSENNGLQWTEYPNSQFLAQNGASGPYFIDMSSTSQVTISDTSGSTLILFSNGFYEAFIANCQLLVVGKYSSGAPSKEKRSLAALDSRDNSAFCTVIRPFCTGYLGPLAAAYLGGAACAGLAVTLGTLLGGVAGGAVGLLGFLGGPEIGIPTTIDGIAIGAEIGAESAGPLAAFLGTPNGSGLCSVGVFVMTTAMCNACPTASSNCVFPGTCGSFNVIYDSSCGPVGDCTCGTDASGVAVCFQDVYCNGATTCATDADCGSGAKCWINNCCGENICAPLATVCPNPPPSRLFRKTVAEMPAEKRSGCTVAAKCN